MYFVNIEKLKTDLINLNVSALKKQLYLIFFLIFSTPIVGTIVSIKIFLIKNDYFDLILSIQRILIFIVGTVILFKFYGCDKKKYF